MRSSGAISLPQPVTVELLTVQGGHDLCLASGILRTNCHRECWELPTGTAQLTKYYEITVDICGLRAAAQGPAAFVAFCREVPHSAVLRRAQPC
jgi:hypothetical protein